MDICKLKLAVKDILALLVLSLAVINSAQVFANNDSSSALVTVGNITLSGNLKTHDYIIYRELLIAEGGIYSSGDFAERVFQSRLNLLNTSLFNFVTIDTVANR